MPTSGTLFKGHDPNSVHVHQVHIMLVVVDRIGLSLDRVCITRMSNRFGS